MKPRVLDNMQYQMDLSALRYYGALFYKYSPKEEIAAFEQACAAETYLKRMPKVIALGNAWPNKVYLAIPHIHFIATSLKVPAELLIMEEKYFNRVGFAGYRIAFEAYRQGLTLAELSVNPYDDTVNTSTSNMYLEAWYTMLNCGLRYYGFGVYFHRIISICREKLKVDIGTLVSKPVKTVSDDITAMFFAETLATLSTTDYAMLLGLARMLQKYKLHKNMDTLEDDYTKLLRWFQDGEKGNTKE